MLRNPPPAERTSPHLGFSVVEVLVALAITALLSAVLIPAIIGKVQDARRSALSQTLFALSQGIAEYRKAVTRYPPTLTVLTTVPVAGVTTDLCGGTNYLSQANVNNWRGPYVSREMLTSGVSMADGVIQNTLTRATSSTSVYLLINATGVERRTATDLESDLDGGAVDSTAGTVRYSGATGASTVTVSYSIPISGC